MTADKKKIENQDNGDADLATDLMDDADAMGKIEYDQKGNMIHSDFEDDDDHHVHNVTSDPPDRFPHEEEFSDWLHHHPLHESEHEWEGAKQMGFDDLHTPGDSEHDEEHHEEPQADDPAAGDAEPLPAGGGLESAEAAGGDPEEPDTSYLDDWGSKAGVSRATPDRGAEQGQEEEEKPR